MLIIYQSKKIYLYFEKYIRKAIDCVPMNDWSDTCTVGIDCTDKDKKQQVLFFDSIQQKNINFKENRLLSSQTNLKNY